MAQADSLPRRGRQRARRATAAPSRAARLCSRRPRSARGSSACDTRRAGIAPRTHLGRRALLSRDAHV